MRKIDIILLPMLFTLLMLLSNPGHVFSQIQIKDFDEERLSVPKTDARGEEGSKSQAEPEILIDKEMKYVAGEDGLWFTDDDEIANSLRSIRVHGKGTHKYDNMRIGINGRLDTLQAAILNTKFKLFPKEVELRQQVAQRYSDLLSKSGNCVITPHVPEGFKSAWAQYSVLAKDQNHRLKIQEKLKAENIPTAIYYPKPLHLQTAYSDLGYTEGSFPVSEDCSNRIFSLPMHPYLDETDRKEIVATLMDS